MDWNNRFRLRCDRALELARVKVVIFSDIHEDWFGASVNDGGHRGHEGVPNSNDFVPGTDACSQERKM